MITSLRTLAVLIIITLGVGCAPSPRVTPSDIMQTQTSQLFGNWEKITRSTCSRIYPDTIQFQKGGLYFGQKDTPGTFTQWDVGSFEVAGNKQIKISIANDAIVTYEFSILNDVLMFIDQDGCQYSYR